MINATVSDLINASMRSAGILAVGESASANEAQDALLSLNMVLEDFSIRGQMVFSTDKLTLTLIPSQQVYTLGNGGDLNISSPFDIYNASILSNGYEQPIYILKTTQEWQNLNINNFNYGLTTNLPYSIFLTGDYPLNKLYVYPTPTTSMELILYVKKQLNTFIDIFQSVEFPQGYFEALMLELAKKICIENGNPISNDLYKQSQRANQNLVSVNAEAPLLQSPFVSNRINSWWGY